MTVIHATGAREKWNVKMAAQLTRNLRFISRNQHLLVVSIGPCIWSREKERKRERELRERGERGSERKRERERERGREGERERNVRKKET